MVTTHNGRKFDWYPRFDPESLRYTVSIRSAEDPTPLLPPQPRLWTPGALLDQGRDGACVGFGWSAELAASPARVIGVNDTFAFAYYHKAQTEDEWPGENYEGTSVLAGAKVAREIGFVTEYRWATTPEEVICAVVNYGPEVEGTDWLDSMFTTHPSGLMEVHGNVVGGHCYLIRGYHPRMRIPGEGWSKRHEVFIVRQSWGPFGKKDSGDFYLPVEDWANKLFRGGEHCVPVHRLRGDVASTPLAAQTLLPPQSPRTV